MFDFGDELVIQSNRTTWLIWIQILVMFLLTLTILLSYFGVFADDFSHNNPSSLSSSCPSSQLEPPSTCSRRTQVTENLGGRDDIQRSTTNRTRRPDNSSERNGSSEKDLASSSVSERFFHPCRFLDLAKQAFLKCLGLGSTSTSRNSPAREHPHED